MTVYLLALGAALLFGVGSVIQQRVASGAPPGKELRLSLLWWLARRPLWLAGVGTAFVGNFLSGSALGLGSVALVQPLLVSRLLFALPLSALWARRRLTSRDGLGVLATAGGLAAFVVAGRPGAASTDSAAPLSRWLAAVLAIALITAALVFVSRRFGPAGRAPLLGAGAGLLFGLQSGLTHTAVRHFIDGGLVPLLTSWTTYGVVVTAVTGTLLAQSAYEMAPLAASYPALAAVEPLTGIGIGIGVLGGTLTLTGLALGVEGAGLAIMTVGIYLLATSPLVTGQLDLLEERADEGQAARTEDQLQREIARLTRNVGRLESGTLPARVAVKTLREACQDLETIDAELDRIAVLREDLATHRQRAQNRARDLPTPQQQEIERFGRRLDAWQHEIDRRDEGLQERAGELHRRVRALDSSETDQSDPPDPPEN